MLSDPKNLGKLAWRVARQCHSGNCVRVAASGNAIVLGDTKHPDGPTLVFSREEWDSFADGIRRGDFNNL